MGGFLRDESAQGLPEYALVVGAVVVMVVVAAAFLFPEIIRGVLADTGRYIEESPQAAGLR